MGRSYDGSQAFKIPAFDNTLDYIALIAFVSTFVVDLTGAVYFGLQLRQKGHLAKLLSPIFICKAIYDGLLLTYFYTDSPPIIDCLYGSIGLFATMLAVIMDAEVLKVFCVMSSFITPRTVVMIEVVVVVWYLVGSIGVNAKFFYMNSTMPQILQFWTGTITPLLVTTLFLYIFVQSVYLMYLTWGRHIQQKRERAKISSHAMDLSRYNYNFFWLLFGFLMLSIVLDGIFWYLGGKNYGGGSPNFTVISFAFGNVVHIVSAGTLIKIRSIKFEQPVEGSMTMSMKTNMHMMTEATQ